MKSVAQRDALQNLYQVQQRADAARTAPEQAGKRPGSTEGDNEVMSVDCALVCAALLLWHVHPQHALDTT
jgi:hypothetical protein